MAGHCNDTISNLAAMRAALGVWGTVSDLFVATIMAGPFLPPAFQIAPQAVADWSEMINEGYAKA